LLCEGLLTPHECPTEVGYRRSGGDASIGGKSEGVEISQPRL
jgi:hypothetical protein